MTEKLYYSDAYISEFSATVMTVSAIGDNYEIVLDKTAFFPEQGGQTADTGLIGDARVLDVKIEREKIIHITDRPLSVGQRVEGIIDFEQRHEKMKCHTAEHILCGIMHRLYGTKNIGFHLGDGLVTVDVSTVLTREQLDAVEDIANRIVSENVEVKAYFPTQEQLSGLQYRSKLDITENVRIVAIGEYDSCACCAPHVASTGEIGIIKMLDFTKHRGGTRIYMLAGRRALLDYRERYAISQRISAMTSAPQNGIDRAVEQLLEERDGLERALKEQAMRIAALLAERVADTDKNAVVLADGLDFDGMRELVNRAVGRVGCMLVALSGEEGNYRYVIGSRSLDLTAVAREISAVLGGRGGGRREMIQGTVTATLCEIRTFFENR